MQCNDETSDLQIFEVVLPYEKKYVYDKHHLAISTLPTLFLATFNQELSILMSV